MALSSSAVAFNRLFEANFGRSDLNICQEKEPPSVRMKRPFAFSPDGELPSGCLAFEET